MDAAKLRALPLGFQLWRPRGECLESCQTTALVQHGAASVVTWIDKVAIMWHTAVRAVFLSSLALSILILYLLMARTSCTRHIWLRLLHYSLQWCGPAFCKWGQWAAARPDLLPPDVRGVLETLHTAAPAHSSHASQATVEAAFGVPLDVLFEHFEEMPFASGAIAQVHCGTLSSTAALLCGRAPGTKVAVKIRHPGIERRLRVDFTIMLQLASLASHVPLLRDIRFYDSLVQFGIPLQQQLHLSLEAQNLDRFAYNFRSSQSVRFPEPLFPLVSDAVLVETFEPGRIVRELVYKQTPHNCRVARAGVQAYLQMMLLDNWMHADLHPGNILVDIGSPAVRLPSWLQAAVDTATSALLGRTFADLVTPVTMTILDAGMTVSLEGWHARALADLFRGIARADGGAIARAVLDLRHRESTAIVDPVAFQDDIIRLFSSVDAEVFRAHTQEIVEDVFSVMRKNHVTIDGAASAVLLTTVTLEGWASTLDPDIRIMDTICSILSPSWAMQMSRNVDRLAYEDALDVT